MKHIYIFNSISRAAEYGIGTYLNQLIKCIANEEGFSVSYVELYAEVKELKITWDKKNNIRRIFFPSPKVYNRKTDRERYYKSIYYLLVPHIFLSEENIFHFNYQQNYPLFQLLKRKCPGCTTVLTLHYLDWGFQLKGNTSRFKYIINKDENVRSEEEKQIYTEYLLDKNAFNEVDKIICLSKYTKDFLSSDYGIPEKKISIIYNGLEEFKVSLNQKKKDIKRKQMLFYDHEHIILFVGRIDHNKGLECLIEAFRLIMKESTNVRLVVVGDGDYNSYFKYCVDIWSKIIFTGKLERKKLYDIYQIADIGVMPSFQEQCSYVAIEMMMHGIPIIGTDSTGLKEMLGRNQKYMLNICETEDEISLSIDSLSQMLLSILKEDELTQAKANSRSDFEEKYTLSIMKTAMMSFYLNI